MRTLLTFALLCATACGDDPPRPAAVCGEEGAPEECGQRCTEARPCPFGFYCNLAAECAIDCIDDEGCGIGRRCDATGQCQNLPSADSGSPRDGGARDNSTICASREVAAGRTTPTVVLVIDQSGSMDEDFGGSNRWDALRDSLLDADGLIPGLQDQVAFGIALFSGDGEAMCPILSTVPPALNNFDAIQAVYGPADTIDETPTGDSLNALLDDFLARPDRTDEPVIFVLATDGEPDTCAQPNPQEGQEESLAAVRRAFENNIQTFVLSVGEGVVSERHLQDIANTGLGRGPGDADAPFFVAGNDARLRDALATIVAGTLSCTIELDGRIDTVGACTGTVELNGLPLPCDDPDGWRAVDENTIELQGEACTRLQDDGGAVLRAEFPCDVLLI